MTIRLGYRFLLNGLQNGLQNNLDWMQKSTSQDFGTETIGKLLIKQAVPASIGILVMSLNILVDTIFVGHWIGSQAIAAINVVLPVSFFIAALGNVYRDWRIFYYFESTRSKRGAKSL